MTRNATSLLDVLVPPGNTWLKELSRRRSDLPAGVRIVRFSEADDDAFADEERSAARKRASQKVAA